MEDKQIVDLYWERSEAAISESANKYGRYCHSIAYRILFDEQDSCECVNDTWLKAWDSMPPHRPALLSAFLGKITRNLAINRYHFERADKRGGGELPVALEELQDCIPGTQSVESVADDLVLKDVIGRFLAQLSADDRRIFLQRYWYFCQIKEIAKDFGMTQSRVKMSLLRSREKLRAMLEKEGIWL